jgi:hypothetical protein
MYSGAIYFDYTKRHLAKLFIRLGKDAEHDELGTLAVPWSDFTYDELSDDEVAALLIHRHELDHAKRFFESPLGLLFFRCYWALTVTTGWLFGEFFIPGNLSIDKLSGSTFPVWLKRNGVAWIRSELRSGRVRSALLPDRQSSDFDAKCERMLDYVDGIAIAEVSVLGDFINALLKRTETMSMGEFANLANRAFDYLSMRCEMPNKSNWTTDQPDLPLHPKWDSILSMEELLEYSALRAEHQVLEALRAPEHAMRHWRERNHGDPYLAGFKLEERSKQDPDVLYLLAQASLRTPIDLVLGTEGEMLVEAHHPSWRFRHHYFTVGDQRDCPRTGRSNRDRSAAVGKARDFKELESRLCQLSTVPQPRVADLKWKAGRTDILGPAMTKSRSSEATRFGAMRAVIDLAETFRDGIAKTARGEVDADEPLLPLHYYRDICSFNNLRSKADFEAIFPAHALAVSSFLTLSLVLPGPDEISVPPFDQALFQRIESAGLSETVALRQRYSVSAIAETIFGKRFSEGLGWET